MMKNRPIPRRQWLQGVAAAPAIGAALEGGVGLASQAEPPVEAAFDKKKQYELPGWAFTQTLEVPLTPRPTTVGSFEQIDRQPGVFGKDDPVPVGEVFHGVADEWGITPNHWAAYGLDPTKRGAEAWADKQAHFRTLRDRKTGEAIRNWGHFPIKCYKIPIQETFKKLRPDATFEARLYGYSGMVPGPTFRMRIGQPVLVRFANQIDSETSVHLHGGHSPSHSDGFPTFYVLQGKSRDYFYPNIVPLRRNPDVAPDQPDGYFADEGEAQSTMWYHDHAMDLTAHNVVKGLAGFALCFSENELDLIRRGVLPGLGEKSCQDPDLLGRSDDPTLEDPQRPGFYRRGKEPYFNPFDFPLVIQDKVVDLPTGQVAYDSHGHNGYLGDTMFVNGIAWPQQVVPNRKIRLRLLNGSNARVLRLRLLKASDFWRLHREGIDDPGAGEDDPAVIDGRADRYENLAQPFLRIGKDTWLWPEAQRRTSMVLTMANRGDIVVDFKQLVGRDLGPGEEEEFILVNTMPQADGRGPKQKLDDAGDPRVLTLPFDVNLPDRQIRLAESKRPIGLMKIVVRGPRVTRDATVEHGTPLQPHQRILDREVTVVREFIFERGKGAWQINGRFYDPNINNATPTIDTTEEWVLRNGGGGWWHPIHIHLEAHQLVRYEKDFDADGRIEAIPGGLPLGNLVDVTNQIQGNDLAGLHDTIALGPNSVARIRMRFRTWRGPFVFHCHNIEHEDMRMMFNFEPVAEALPPNDLLDPDIAPNARTHGNDVTLNNRNGELPFEQLPVPPEHAEDVGNLMIPSRPRPKPRNP